MDILDNLLASVVSNGLRVEIMISSLFDTASIRDLQLKNRFVRSATAEGLATVDGCPSQRLKDVYCALADGEVGFIITSGSYIEARSFLKLWVCCLLLRFMTTAILNLGKT